MKKTISLQFSLLAMVITVIVLAAVAMGGLCIYELEHSLSGAEAEEIVRNIATKVLFAALALIAIFSLVITLVVRKLVAPLKQLTKEAQELADNDYKIEIIHSRTEEIEQLSTTFAQMAEKLEEHDAIQHALAFRDSLTGLENNNAYMFYKKELDKKIQSGKAHFGVIVMDLNFLKQTNDGIGHDVGNQLLSTAGKIIAETFTRSKTYRIGGDEFIVILQGRDLDEHQKLTGKFDEQCAASSFVAHEKVIPVKIAHGTALFDPATDDEFDDVFTKADQIMYVNKQEMKKNIPTFQLV